MSSTHINVYMVRHPKDAHIAVPSGKADYEIKGEINVYLMQKIDKLKIALKQKGWYSISIYDFCILLRWTGCKQGFWTFTKMDFDLPDL